MGRASLKEGYNMYPSLVPDAEGNDINPQNPSYDPRIIDRWGSYRAYRDLKSSLGDLARFFPYVQQEESESHFDPAAWCLKQITLPSGGEIHVQYEQNDYQFVQDELAMLMVPLHPLTNTNEQNATHKKYYLDLQKAGFDLAADYPTNDDKEALAKQLFEPMTMDGERMFFNFLYALIGNDVSYDETTSDYIEGYARISGFGWDNSGIYFVFKGNGPSSNYININYPNNASKWELPRKACERFYRTQRRGRIGAGVPNAFDELGEGTAEAEVNAITQFFEGLGNVLGDDCKEFDPTKSYVRVQMPIDKAKRGGGVRVKRLLTLAPAVTSGELATLYGTEYDYTMKVKESNPDSPSMSSGVATNEPGVGRRENALVKVIEKDQQSWANAILVGRDMYGQEGPLGESLLPGPSIGYEQVTVRNIHQGVTHSGATQHRYHTCREHPFKPLRTSIKHANQIPHPPIGIPYGEYGVSYQRKAPHYTQGYSFISNSMHGQPKSTVRYSDLEATAAVDETYYEYFKPGEQVQVMGDDMTVTSQPYEYFGKQSEVLGETRQVSDFTVDGAASVDVSTGTACMPILPPPFTLCFPVAFATVGNIAFGFTEQHLKTHVITKTVSYPAMLRSVTTYKDGIRHIDENVLFDKYTGTAVAVRSEDDFQGTYLNQSLLASWEYDNFKPSYLNQDLVLSTSNPGVDAIRHGNDGRDYIEIAGDNSCGALAKFTRGDYLQFNYEGALYHVEEVDHAAGLLYLDKSVLADKDLSAYNVANPITDIRVLESGYMGGTTGIGNILFHSVNEDITGYTNPGLGSQEFVDELNTQLGGLTSPGTSTLSLPGPFPNMDMSQYASYFPHGCNADPSDVEVTNMELQYTLTASGQLELSVLGFSVPCPGLATYSTPIYCSNP